MATKALIVVDVQNDFIDGTLPVPGAADVVDRIAAEFRLTDADYVVTTQDWHVEPGDHFKKWPVHGVANTEGAQLSPRIAKLPFDARFYKGQYDDGYSGFEGVAEGKLSLGTLTRSWEMSLGEFLKAANVTDVDIVGLALDYCVKATALDAQRLGFTTRVLGNMTAATDLKNVAPSVKELEEAGVEVV